MGFHSARRLGNCHECRKIRLAALLAHFVLWFEIHGDGCHIKFMDKIDRLCQSPSYLIILKAQRSDHRRQFDKPKLHYVFSIRLVSNYLEKLKMENDYTRVVRDCYAYRTNYFSPNPSLCTPERARKRIWTDVTRCSVEICGMNCERHSYVFCKDRCRFLNWSVLCNATPWVLLHVSLATFHTEL